MRFTERQFKDSETKRLSRDVAAVFSNVSLDNMRSFEITGTTNASANTSSKFTHSLGTVPKLVLPQEGNIYIPRQGIGQNSVDVRSSVASESFRLILIA